jgi:hypothetical protein
VELRITAAYLSSSGEALLRCSIFEAETSRLVARVAVPVSVASTVWPIWEDAIMLSDDGSFTSTRFGWRVNATNELLEAAATHDHAYLQFYEALDLPIAVFDAVSAVAANRSLPFNNNIGGRSEFSLTLNGPTKLVLVAPRRSFVFDSTAVLGAAPCNVHGVSASGKMLLLTTPSFAEVCPAASNARSDCGYVPLTVYTMGVGLSCPPFCPGVVGDANTILSSGGFGPSAVLPGGAYEIAWLPPRSAVGSAALAIPASPAMVSTSIGLYYALECFQTGHFTDPSSGACANASNPASFYCAYGSADSCRRCDSNALCPGGSRMWPRQGAWAATSTSGTVLTCPAPATERCIGWDAAADTAICGPKYRAGSYLCSACASGHFDPGDGTCTVCPVTASAWERYNGLFSLFAGLAVFVGLVYTSLFAVVHIRGGTVAGLASGVVTLGVWAALALQTLALVASDSLTSSSLPGPLKTFYSTLSVLTLEVCVFM